LALALTAWLALRSRVPGFGAWEWRRENPAERAESKAMGDATLESFLAGLATGLLGGAGFAHARAMAFERKTDGLCQMIAFQRGVSNLRGKFTVNLGWRIELRGDVDPHVLDGWKRIGLLRGRRDLWYDESDPEDCRQVEDILAEDGLPYLDAHDSIEKLVSAYEESGGRRKGLFGSSDLWIGLNAGLCYAHLGRRDEALKFLRGTVEAKKTRQLKFVGQIAREAIARIEEDAEGCALAKPVRRRRAKSKRV